MNCWRDGTEEEIDNKWEMKAWGLGNDLKGKVELAQEGEKLTFGAHWGKEEICNQEAHSVELFCWE